MFRTNFGASEVRKKNNSFGGCSYVLSYVHVWHFVFAAKQIPFLSARMLVKEANCTLAIHIAYVTNWTTSRSAIHTTSHERPHWSSSCTSHDVTGRTLLSTSLWQVLTGAVTSNNGSICNELSSSSCVSNCMTIMSRQVPHLPFPPRCTLMYPARTISIGWAYWYQNVMYTKTMFANLCDQQMDMKNCMKTVDKTSWRHVRERHVTRMHGIRFKSNFINRASLQQRWRSVAWSELRKQTDTWADYISSALWVMLSLCTGRELQDQQGVLLLMLLLLLLWRCCTALCLGCCLI